MLLEALSLRPYSELEHNFSAVMQVVVVVSGYYQLDKKLIPTSVGRTGVDPVQTETAWTMTDAEELSSKKLQLAVSGFAFIGLTVKHRSAADQNS